MIKENKLIWILIIGSILIAFLCVFMFTRERIISVFDLSQTGQIGDTIGGITAPIFGLAGFIMVFYSFKQQLRANQIQIKALDEQKKEKEISDEFNNLLGLLDNLDRKIDIFEYTDTRNSTLRSHSRAFASGIEVQYVKIQGATAINMFSDRLSSTPDFYDEHINLRNIECLPDYYYIVKYADYIKQKIINSKLNMNDKNMLTDRFDLLYRTKLQSSMELIINKYAESNQSNKILDEIKEILIKL